MSKPGWMHDSPDEYSLPYPFYPSNGGEPFYIHVDQRYWHQGQRLPDQWQLGTETFFLNRKLKTYETARASRMSGLSWFGGLMVLGMFISLGAPIAGGVVMVLAVFAGIFKGCVNLVNPPQRHRLDTLPR